MGREKLPLVRLSTEEIHASKFAELIERHAPGLPLDALEWTREMLDESWDRIVSEWPEVLPVWKAQRKRGLAHERRFLRFVGEYRRLRRALG